MKNDAKRLLSLWMLALCLACGGDDLESGSKFISKTQRDRDGHPSGSDIHRCYYRGNTVVCGLHGNAYLINKVHEKDHPNSSSDARDPPYLDMTVEVQVGWWATKHEDCDNPCMTDDKVTAGESPDPTTCTSTDEGADPASPDDDTVTEHDCTWHSCLGGVNATEVVNAAIDKWLAPLRTPYSSTENPIISGGYIDNTDPKDVADLTVNFACSHSSLASKIPCPISCTRYRNASGGYTTIPSSDGSCDKDSSGACAHNQPVIQLGDGRLPKENHRDTLGEHDKLNLLHEIGHAFGLADTHDGGVRIGKQPRAIMAWERIGERGNNDLLLGKDDKAGVQWLYEHHRRGQRERDCHFDEYEYNSNTGQEGCEPRYVLIVTLKNRNHGEAVVIIDTDPNLDINEVEEETGNSALHYAIIEHANPINTDADTAGYLLVIQELLDYAGINLNLKDKTTGRTPLHLAVQFNQQRIVILLLAAAGILVQTADDKQQTALHYAASLGHTHLISAMLASFGSHVEAQDSDGKTALHLAAANGHADTVSFFSAYTGGGIAALAGTEDNDGNTALHLAAENGRTDVVAVILRADRGRTFLNSTNDRDETPLHLAAKFGRDDVVASLLRQTDVDINRQDVQGNTPLHLAALHNRPAVVRLLLNKSGIDTTISNGNDKTARDEAVSHRHTDVIDVFDGGDTLYGTSSAERLIQALKVGNIDPDEYCTAGDSDCRQKSALTIMRTDQNLDVNYTEPSTGNTALHYAVQGDDPVGAARGPYETVVDLLVRRTLLNPNLKNTNGATPLHLAVRHAKLETVRLLLGNRRLDANLTNNVGETALHIAVDLAHENILAELLRYRSGTVDVNLQDDTGRTPLHIAAEQRNPEVVQMLVDDRRVDVNLRTRTHDETALHIAAEFDNDEVVEVLLRDADIDVNLQDATGSTALHSAAHHGSTAVVTLLLDVPNIDLTILDNQQLSAYGRAEASGSNDVVEIFDNLDRGDDVVFRGTLMEELRDKGSGEDVEDVALDILNDDEDDLDVNERDRRSGKTPLHYAVEYEYARLLAALLAHPDLQINLKDGEGETALHHAVRLQQASTVTDLLRHRAIEVNATDRDGDTALLLAVREQEQAIVTLLARHRDIDANRKDRAGDTPLLLAVKSKNANLVGILLRTAGVEVNLKDGDGDAPLHIAIRGSDTPVVTQLAAVAAIEANHKNADGDTALHIAARNKKSGLVRTLLSIAGIDVDVKDRGNKTALHLAVAKRDAATVTHLLEHSSIDVNAVVTGVEGRTALHLAIAQHIATDEDYSRVIDLLLGHLDIDVNVKNSHQESLLLLTVKEEETALITKLLAHANIEVNSSNSRQKTSLMFAAERGSLNIVHQLLAHRDIDVNVQDNKRFTALHFAAHHGQVAVVRALLAHAGIDTALRDRWNLTPRKRAKARGHTGVVAVFDEYEAGNVGSAVTLLAELARGDSEESVLTIIAAKRGNVAVNAVDDSNAYTALHYAARRGYLRVVNALLDYDAIEVNAASAGLERPLHLAARGGHERVVRALLAHGRIQINVRDSRGVTPLHRAVVGENNALVQALLGHTGIRPTLATNNGYTALHWAAQLGYDGVVRLLLNKQPRLINIKTVRGRTALYYAAWFGHTSTVQQLLRETAVNVNARDEDGDTALHKVAAYDRLAVARLLLEAGASTQISNKKRERARDIAEERGYVEIVALIDSY